MKKNTKHHFNLKLLIFILIVLVTLGFWKNAKSIAFKPVESNQSTADNPAPPTSPVRLIFIHHSTGGYWLADNHGGLGVALRDNNYFVSATNYEWSADGEVIGDYTDIGDWYNWFGSNRNSVILQALYTESGKNVGDYGDYSRLPDTEMPTGENEIILFKSCFPNSALGGEEGDLIPEIGDNPLRGQDAWSEHMTIANAKGIYLDLLPYFQSRPDKLFIVITAPPLSDDSYADNARAFNNWLVSDWLDNYPLQNVAVFDFFNVLTTNGGDADTNDLNEISGNHHRWWNNAIQHKTDGDGDSSPNVLEYPSGPWDDHPSAAGDQKATAEFILLLNIFYNRWQDAQSGNPTATATATTTATATSTSTPTSTATTTPPNEDNFNNFLPLLEQ